MSIFDRLTGREDPRFKLERLKQVVAALPANVYVNPIWSALLFMPLLLWPATFGRVPVSHLLIAFCLHAVMSTHFFVLYNRYRKPIRDVDAAERVLVWSQLTVSGVWGVIGWLYWQSGDGVNNIYVTMIMVAVVWAVMYTRLAHTRLFLAGTLPLIAVYSVRVVTAPGQVALALSYLVPLWITYVSSMAIVGRRRIDNQLRTQFANEDLSIALRASNEEAVRKRYEAEAANSAKTAFLANMSHELRTPLNAILGFSDIIAHQALGPNGVARNSEYARDIHASGAHLLSLINDLLDVAKIEAGKMQIDPRPLDPAAALAEVERLMSPRALSRHQTVHYSVAPDLGLVVADERAFRQIALNLVSNAVKFTQENGRIDVACRRSRHGGLQLDVSDNGPGIPPEKLDRVFQPFTQIDNRYSRQPGGGTGLGLALVRGLAELHGGSAAIKSMIGHGTTVSIHFPLMVERQARLAAANE